jgi:hypothetical protein
VSQSPHVSTDYLEDSVRVVALIGEHDVSTRETVLGELERVTRAGVRVIVDLTGARVHRLERAEPTHRLSQAG